MFDINNKIKESMYNAVKSTNLSRANVLDKMQQLAKENDVQLSPRSKDGQLSLAIFEKWLNVNAKDYYPSAQALVIFCAAVENNAPFRAAVEPFGYHFIDQDQIRELEEAEKLYAEYKENNSVMENSNDNSHDNTYAKEKTSKRSIDDMLEPEITVHRIVPTIKEYGTGMKTYHLQIWKEYYQKYFGYHRHSNKKQQEYCVDASDEDIMYVIAKELKVLLEKRTDARIIINETFKEFILHSKAKKIYAGHYWYRGYTIYDISWESKEWRISKGEHKDKQPPTPPFEKTIFATLKLSMEYVDKHIDGKVGATE